jgi:hypothetical protein
VDLFCGMLVESGLLTGDKQDTQWDDPDVGDEVSQSF